MKRTGFRHGPGAFVFEMLWQFVLLSVETKLKVLAAFLPDIAFLFAPH